VGAAVLALRMATDRSYARHLGYLVIACILAQRLSRLSCTHIHAHFGTNSAAVACIASRLSGLPYSVTYHGTYELEAPGQRIKIERAKFVITVTEVARSWLLQRHPQQVHKILLIRCGLAAKWMGMECTPPAQIPAFVSVSRLSAHKDPMLLLAAIERLVSRGFPVRVTMVGDGPLRAEVEQQISVRGLGNHVLLLGWCDSDGVRHQLRESRALVLSSASEGLPVAIMEAFALGRCAIATDVGGVSELVESGVTGWLVPNGDPDALADAMEECLQASRVQLSQLGDAARRRIELLNADSSVRRLVEAFLR